MGYVLRVVVVSTFLAASVACTTESIPEKRGNLSFDHPAASAPQRRGPCQPFPDRLIDDFLEAYNNRDLRGLQALVDATPIKDVVPAAYAGTSTFDDVAEWAETGWEVNDRMDLVGYSAFYPTRRGFQMLMTRRSPVLRNHGIEAVSTTLDAVSRGCSITSLEMSDVVQAKSAPCAFYERFGTVDDVLANEPRACRDGSGNHARVGHAAVGAGELALLWGGSRGGNFGTYGDIALDGLAIDPASRRWSRIPEPSLPPLMPEVSVWSGRELIVLGNKAGGRGVVGGAYEPTRRAWRILDFPYRGWSGFEGVWTGAELVLWGGPDHSERPRHRGAIYDPATGSWRKTSAAPIAGRWSHSVVWTGTEMIVWGGGNANTDLADGAAYDPATDSWRRIADSPLSPRQWLPIVWTEKEVIVWGGSSYSRARADGAAYNPVTDSWRKLPPAPLRPRHYHSATWTGSEVVVYGGYDFHRTFRDGAAYDPETDSWRRIPRAPIASRCCHSALWTGTSIFVFGGSEDPGHMALGDGALYDPTLDRWQRLIPR